jgi:TerB N-terminal domain/TerB-C domain
VRGSEQNGRDIAMARRKSAGSPAGMGVIILLGGIIWLGSAVYQFVLQYSASIIALLVIAGLVSLIIIGLSRVGKSKPTTSVAADASPELQAQIAGPFLSRGSSRKAANARWMNPGSPIRIQRHDITDGLFYLGEALALPDGRIIDQYVINSRLSVSDVKSDVSGQSMPYWPSYASISSEARGTFLAWMADGRRDPTYNIGYVFLFFYGLEHRQFIDTDEAIAQTLIAEVDRLLSIYGQNGSFRGYATNFLTHAKVGAGLPLDPLRLSAERSFSQELPLAVRIYFGQKLASSNTLYAEDMLLWLLALPDTYLRTPAIRCFDEFAALWKLRFAGKFPSGVKINVPAKKIKCTYRAASGAFQVDVPGQHTQYPDIAAVRQSFDKFEMLAQACTDELDGFSRYVGKHPDKRSSIQAVLLLPEILQHDSSSGTLHDIVERIKELMGARNTAATTLREVLKAAAFDHPEAGKLPRAIGEQIGLVLDRINVAIEPDRRYGGGAAQLEDQVVIFTAEQGGPIDPEKPAYQRMKVQVEVSALAASADGAATVDELQTIIANIKSDQYLTKIEGLRLIAYAITIFKSPPKQSRIMRRLVEASEVDRQAIAMAAVSVIGREDQVDPKRVQFLERLSKVLKLPKEKVYSDLHRRVAAPDEPVVVSPESRVPGIPIPTQPQTRIYIDPARLAVVQKQTQAVSQILTKIFVDDAGPPKLEGVFSHVANESVFGGLDRNHAELVEYLEIRGEIDKQEFEERAKALKLLPAGAIEKINDWAFDHFDEPLLEDGEHIVLSPHLRERLVELRANQS